MTNAGFATLAGKRCVVTGSSSGIGRAVAVELARAGGDVAGHCHRSVRAAQELVEAIRALGRNSELFLGDVANEQQAAHLAEQVWEFFGGVDVWVNNAGADLLTGNQAGLDYSEKLDRLWRTDVAGTVRLAKLVGHRMKEAGSGVILNIGWDQAERGMEGDSGELFAAAKNAVMGFTRSLALSLAPQVRVNCIAPGWIRTAWGEQASDYWQQRVRRETPLGRWGTPEDVAKMARFLASDEAAFITGQVINVNGGAVR